MKFVHGGNCSLRICDGGVTRGSCGGLFVVEMGMPGMSCWRRLLQVVFHGPEKILDPSGAVPSSELFPSAQLKAI
jgi:hypothetical protein